MESEILHLIFEPRTLLIFVFVLLLALYLSPNKYRNLPPGPAAWPLIGHAKYLLVGNKELYRHLHTLYRKYGHVIRLTLGGENLVFISGSKLIHKTAIEENEKFRFRPQHLYSFSRTFGPTGLLMSNGDHQSALRKFTLVAFKDFGVGKQTLEERIHEELDYLTAVLEKSEGEPTCYNETYKEAVSNIISNIVFGERFDYDDPQFRQNVEDVDALFNYLSFTMPENFLPILEYLPGSKLKKALTIMKRLKDYIRSQIQKHRETFDQDDIRDFVDLYLRSHETSGNKHITEECMFTIIVELFNAGTDSTSTILAWAILYLTNNPEIQDKCRAEIHQVVGRERLLRVSDKHQLPYLQAIIYETLRISTAAVLTPRTVLSDTKFSGFDIPKQSFVFLDLYSALMDPGVWDNPHEFIPERFLDHDGQFDDAKESFIPFGIGGRACLGAHLAKMEMLIFLGTLLQRFKFEAPRETPILDTTSNMDGVITKPPDYKVCAKLY